MAQGDRIVEHSPIEIVAVDDEAAFWDDRSDLLACLRETPPRLPTYFGYDAAGSDLFESITELPNYYVSRVEHELLQHQAGSRRDWPGCGTARPSRWQPCRRRAVPCPPPCSTR